MYDVPSVDNKCLKWFGVNGKRSGTGAKSVGIYVWKNSNRTLAGYINIWRIGNGVVYMK